MMSQVVVAPTTVALFQHIPWFAWVAMLAIAGGMVSGIVKMIIVHRERMAMIHRGIDPDAPARRPIYEDLDA